MEDASPYIDLDIKKLKEKICIILNEFSKLPYSIQQTEKKNLLNNINCEISKVVSKYKNIHCSQAQIEFEMGCFLEQKLK